MAVWVVVSYAFPKQQKGKKERFHVGGWHVWESQWKRGGALGGSSQLVSGQGHPHSQAIKFGHLEGVVKQPNL